MSAAPVLGGSPLSQAVGLGDSSPLPASAATGAGRLTLLREEMLCRCANRRRRTGVPRPAPETRHALCVRPQGADGRAGHLQFLEGQPMRKAGVPDLRDVVGAQVQHLQGEVSLQPTPVHTADLIVLPETHKGEDSNMPLCKETRFSPSFLPDSSFSSRFIKFSKSWCSSNDASLSVSRKVITCWLGATKN